MEYLPLTRTANFEEIPPNSGMDPLFDELAPLARAPFEVTVAVGRGCGRRVLMDLIVAEDDVRRAFAVAFEQGGGLDDFEVTVRRHRA